MSSDEMIEQPENSTGAYQGAPGELLKIAREKAGLSQTDIADKLKISASYISAIEDSAFDRIPAELVFIRGYIRRYARLVSLGGDELVTAFDRFTGDSCDDIPSLKEGKPIEVQRHMSPFVSWGGTLVTILLVGAVSYYGWNSGQKSEALDTLPVTEVQDLSDEESFGQEQHVQEQSDSGTEEGAYAEEVNSSLQEEAVEAPVNYDDLDTEQEMVDVAEPLLQPEAVKASVEEIEETAAAPVEVVSSGVRLVVRFVEDCWVQVKDMNGKSIYSDVQKAGSELDMQVPAAVEVKFGNVPGVDKLNFAGRTVEVKAATPGRKVASLRLGSVDAG